MLVNPYEITPLLIEDDNATETSEVINELVWELLEQKLGLINDYQEGKASYSLVELEVKKLINSKEIPVNQREAMTKKVLSCLFGYEMLEPYVEDPDITDILVNKYNVAYIKKFGQKIPIPINFGSEENFLKYLYKIATLCGGRLDENNNAEAVLTDRKRNMRIVISIKPINAVSPSLCIRKHSRHYSLKELVELGMLEQSLKTELEDAVKQRKNIIIAGQGGSGKSTLLGALIEVIPWTHRVLLIQETFELYPKHPDIVCKLVRTSNNPAIREYSLFELTKIGLLMSLDRLIIGELKDREAYDFFNAIFTGHEGSMATIHAPSADQVIRRLLQLMSRAHSDIPYSVLEDMLYTSLDMVIFMDDFKVKEVKWL